MQNKKTGPIKIIKYYIFNRDSNAIFIYQVFFDQYVKKNSISQFFDVLIIGSKQLTFGYFVKFTNREYKQFFTFITS